MPQERVSDTTCPTIRDGDDEVARQWAAGALGEKDAAEFEKHMLHCSACHRAVEYAGGVTGALRSAAHVTPAPSPLRRWSIPIAIALAALVLALVIRLGGSP